MEPKLTQKPILFPDKKPTHKPTPVGLRKPMVLPDPYSLLPYIMKQAQFQIKGSIDYFALGNILLSMPLLVNSLPLQ